MQSDEQSTTDEIESRPEVMDALGGGQVLGYDAQTGRSRIEFTCKPEFCHSGGIAQGGFVTGWMDAAMAFAAMSRTDGGIWLATLELKVSFLAASRAGMEVVAEGRIVKPGKSIVFLEATLREVGQERLLATSSSTRVAIRARTATRTARWSTRARTSGTTASS